MAIRRAAAGVIGLALWVGPGGGEASAGEPLITSLAMLVNRVGSCISSAAKLRRPPGMEVTLVVAFTRAGDILGKPMVVYESPSASQADRLVWRELLMNGLQRCTPLPISDGLGNAVAGRPLRVKFDGRHLTTADNQERISWQLPKIL